MVAARRILSSVTMALCAGTSLNVKISDQDEGETQKWTSKGAAAFSGEQGEEMRATILGGVIEAGQGVTWCDEQVRVLVVNLTAHQYR